MKTMAQILGAPLQAVYVTYSPGHRDYCRQLARDVGRGDLKVNTVHEILHTNAGRGVREFVVDHAVWFNFYGSDMIQLVDRTRNYPPSRDMGDLIKRCKVLESLVMGFLDEVDESSETAMLAAGLLNVPADAVLYVDNVEKAARVQGYIDAGGASVESYVRSLNR